MRREEMNAIMLGIEGRMQNIDINVEQAVQIEKIVKETLTAAAAIDWYDDEWVDASEQRPQNREPVMVAAINLNTGSDELIVDEKTCFENGRWYIKGQGMLNIYVYAWKRWPKLPKRL